MCNNRKDKEGCIAEILTVICLLQKNSSKEPGCLDTCDKGFLGSSYRCEELNTRPVMLYTCDGKPWSMPISRKNDSCSEHGDKSCVFRVEKIDGNCATLRVLEEHHSGKDEFLATNSFFTIDLSCICAIRCLEDTIVDI